MDAGPQCCDETGDPLCSVCETDQTEIPLRRQKTMGLRQQYSNVGGREQIDDVGRDEAIIGTGSCLELKGPIGPLDGHAAAKVSEPCLSQADHDRTIIDGDIAYLWCQVRSQKAFRKRACATPELEDCCLGLKRRMRDEIACGSFLVEGLPILFSTHPIVKGSRLLLGQDSPF